MRNESVRTDSPKAIRLQGSAIPDGERNFTRNRIIVARALWPRKTAANLAAEAGCSERQAKFYLAGQRWSLNAVRVLVAKII